MAKGGRVTYDGSNPAYVDLPGGERFTFPPFSTLVASGVTDCAVAVGLYGEGERQRRIAGINHRIEKVFGNGT